MCQLCANASTKKRRSRSIQSNLRQDPTRTQSLRNRFEADMARRFSVLKKEIWDAVVNKDVFGLDKWDPLLSLNFNSNNLNIYNQEIKTNLEVKQFQFSSSNQKINGFMDWLFEMQDKNILETSIRPGTMYDKGITPWTNIYIQSSYQRGMSRARSELRKAGYDVPSAFGVDFAGKSSVAAAFNQPFNIDRVAVIYTRAFSELKGITGAMDQQISRVLAQGLTEGRNPKEIARMLVDRVDKIGLTRARTLARTEVINAHHQATINEYEQWGVLGVSVEAEWVTAGYNVCPYCASQSGKVFTLQQIRSMIPAHPNCRCVAIPIRRGKQIAELPQEKEFTPAELDELFQNGWRHDAPVKKAMVSNKLWNVLKNDPDFAAYSKMFTEIWDKEDFYNDEWAGLRTVRTLIHNWAETSGDKNITALMLQQAAQIEFNLTSATLSHLPMEYVTESEMKMRAFRKFLRAQYNLTQQTLKEHGIGRIKLYRGAYFAEDLGISTGVGDVKTQPMSSYSTDRGTAVRFANELSDIVKTRLLIEQTVPAERILSTTMTGFGCTGEHEFVVLGGVDKANLIVKLGGQEI